MSDWTKEKLQSLAVGWFDEIRAKDRDEETTDDYGDAVVLMNFTAPTEAQWDFIKLAVATATDESEFFAVAAGPFEHLMGFHGESYIDQVECFAATNHSFRKMVSGSSKHLMSDDVWARVQAIKATRKAKLDMIS